MKERNPYVEKVFRWIQPLFIFGGVYSAFLCTIARLNISVERGDIWPALLLLSFVFLFAFRYLERISNGRMIGLCAVLVMDLILFVRSFTAIIKGGTYVINCYLKQLMDIMHIRVELLSYCKESKFFSNSYCATMFFLTLGILLVALICMFYNTKARQVVFLICTMPFVILPIAAGRSGYYAHMVVYICIAGIMLATGNPKADTAAKYIREKVSIIMTVIMSVVAFIALLICSPTKFDGFYDQLYDMQMNLISIGEWDVFDWVKANVGYGVAEFGRVGNKASISYSGEKILEIQSGEGLSGKVYLKGYVGDCFADNRWTTFLEESRAYETELATLRITSPTVEDWTSLIFDALAEKRTRYTYTLLEESSSVDTMTIKNIAMGRANKVIPYYNKDGISANEDGRYVVNGGSKYEVEYYPRLFKALFEHTLLSNYRTTAFFDNDLLDDNKAKMRNFIRKYYLEVPEGYADKVFQDFFLSYSGGPKSYVSDFSYYGDDIILPEDYIITENFNTDIDEAIAYIKNYLAGRTEYTLSPGKTPEGEDAIDYFLNENKKGYCVHYATTAVMLFRSIGIPARYVEGVRVDLGSELTTDIVNVKDYDLHAWVECYRDDLGWIPVEVTPGVAEPTPSQEPESTLPDTLPAEPTAEPEPTTEPEMEIDPSTSDIVPEDEEDMEFENVEDENAYDENGESSSDNNAGNNASIRDSKAWKFIWPVVAVIMVLLLVQIQVVVRQRIYRNRLKKRSTRGRVVKMYLHARPLLKSMEVDYQGELVDDYIERLCSTTGVAKERVSPFVQILMKAEFGGTRIEKEDWLNYQKSYKKIMKNILRKKSLAKRLYFRYIRDIII